VSRWQVVRPWLGVLARLTLAGVWIVAGAAKVGDLAGSGRAVAAYKLLPVNVAQAVGAALPFVELALGVLLLLGLATRLAATVSAALLAVYIGGIASVWARGLSIDCGCFGGGGTLAAGQRPNYAPDIARDAGLLVLAAFLVIWPRTRLAVDRWLAGDEPAVDAAAAADDDDDANTDDADVVEDEEISP
jgi:uncharacterized membrane protein YphA (DoxX/SURF4 family)